MRGLGPGRGGVPRKAPQEVRPSGHGSLSHGRVPGGGGGGSARAPCHSGPPRRGRAAGVEAGGLSRDGGALWSGARPASVEEHILRLPPSVSGDSMRHAPVPMGSVCRAPAPPPPPSAAEGGPSRLHSPARVPVPCPFAGVAGARGAPVVWALGSPEGPWGRHGAGAEAVDAVHMAHDGPWPPPKADRSRTARAARRRAGGAAVAAAGPRSGAAGPPPAGARRRGRRALPIGLRGGGGGRMSRGGGACCTVVETREWGTVRQWRGGVRVGGQGDPKVASHGGGGGGHCTLQQEHSPWGQVNGTLLLVYHPEPTGRTRNPHSPPR